MAGIPPSSLQFRCVLLPVLGRLPSTEGQPTGYGRVLAELQAHAERLEARVAMQSDLIDEPKDSDDREDTSRWH